MIEITQYGIPGFVDPREIILVLAAHECLEHAGCSGAKSEIFIRGRQEPFFADESPNVLNRRITEALALDFPRGWRKVVQ